jgi:hypothetical protein
VKKDIKDEWVRRLRSGDYEQGQGYLRFGDKYCCLGVLCDMAVEAGVIEETHGPSEKFSLFVSDGGDFQTQMLPISVAKWAGLMGTPAVTIKENGDIRVHADLPYDIPREVPENGWIPQGAQDLMEANDFEGCSFEEIATMIEAGIEADS